MSDYISNTWYEYIEEFKNINYMNTQPSKLGYTHPNIGTVIDEEKSVRWNREEVDRLRAEYDKKASELKREKDLKFNELKREILNKIVDELDNKITKESALTILNRSWEDGHSYGINQVFIELNKNIEFIENILNTK